MVVEYSMTGTDFMLKEIYLKVFNRKMKITTEYTCDVYIKSFRIELKLKIPGFVFKHTLFFMGGLKKGGLSKGGTSWSGTPLKSGRLALKKKMKSA
jgi:hypothetical protein